MSKKILITGISGQDGAYLANNLVKNNQVFGITRNKSNDNLWKLLDLKILKKIKIFEIDILNSKNLDKFLLKYNFDEVYNLAGYSSVQKSIKEDKLTNYVNIISLFNILNFYRKDKKIKIFHSLSSEIFGKVSQSPQNEKTVLNPVTPYGFSKKINFLTLKEYRKFYNLKIYSAIFYNHNSKFSSKDFVLNKIANAFKKFKKNEKYILKLGNINVKRDWGCAKEYMEGIIKIMASKKPDDYIVATGSLFSIKELIIIASKLTSVKINWKYDKKLIALINNSKNMRIEFDEKLLRKNDTGKQYYFLKGSNYKINKIIKWKPKIKADKILKNLIFEKN